MRDSPVTISRLAITLPNGVQLLRDVNLEVGAGEVVVLLGGSGSGKSTLSRALFEPDRLSADGYELVYDALEIDRDSFGLVPQRGALFDHLDVSGNLELAIRYGESGGGTTIAQWLERVSLDPALADAATGALSGGQAQRVAVARALAAGRRVLFLDEPSVGLDPLRVRELARVVRDQVETHGIAAIIVTHDVSLAAGAADRILFLEPETGSLEPIFARTWPGPQEAASDEERGAWMTRLEAEVVTRIEKGARAVQSRRATRSASAIASLSRALITSVARPFAISAAALRHIPGHLWRRPGDFARVAARTLRQTLLRPLPFYLIVAALIGYTVLFVISKIGGAGVRPDALIRQIGGSYVLALAPPLSAILYVAASGAAANAWLGSITLTRQVVALEALGVEPRAYLWAPVWLVTGLVYLVVAAAFAAAMLAGGWILATQQGLPDAFDLLVADLIDPRPERATHVTRALFLTWIYAWGIASDVVAKGTAGKRDADDVTRAMTGSVVACTLWVVLWELTTAVWIFV